MHLHREVENLKKKVLYLDAVVEETLQRSINALKNRDEKLAKEVLEKDSEIDHLEVELEEDCLKILALYQPVAKDLRFIVGILKINNDLERIGDLACNVAERAFDLSYRDKFDIPFDFQGMASHVQEMLHVSIDAMISSNAELAYEVIAMDEKVDIIYREMYPKLEATSYDCPEKLDILLQWVSVSRNLERIADHATNIAEDVIYMLKGTIVRHTGL